MKAGARVLLSRLKEKEDGEDSKETQKDSLTPEMIVRGIPKTMKTRALALLARLKEREDVITWDNVGQVVLSVKVVRICTIFTIVGFSIHKTKHERFWNSP